MKRWETSPNILRPQQSIETFQSIEPTLSWKNNTLFPRAICKTPSSWDRRQYRIYYWWWRPLVIHYLCTTCASAHNVDSVSANLSVSVGSISKLLKTLLFLAFQMYHSIHANWWSSICGKILQNRWSMFVKRELVGKIVGFDGIFERAQTWRTRGH